MSVTLVAAAVGGIGFGWFADRFGRARALTVSMLVYSIATALCGLTQTATQLILCRVVLGLGMGGEWASGAALVAEIWPARHRGKALALVQSSWAVGYALGAGVVAVVMPRFGWRAVFFVGIAPALGHALVATESARAGGMARVADAEITRWQTISWGAGLQRVDLRHDECGDAFCVVGIVHMDASLSVDASRGRGPGSQRCPDIGMDYCHASGLIPRLCRLWVSCGPL